MTGSITLKFCLPNTPAVQQRMLATWMASVEVASKIYEVAELEPIYEGERVKIVMRLRAAKTSHRRRCDLDELLIGAFSPWPR
jgi:hypothetical protein